MSEKKCHYQYTVRRGDSFYLIAHRLGVPLRDLLEANSEINPARLTVGDVLCIPAVSEEPADEPAPTQTAQTTQASAQPTPAPAQADASASAEATKAAPAPAVVPSEPAATVSDEPSDLLDHPAVDAPAQAETAAQSETSPQVDAAAQTEAPAPTPIAQPAADPTAYTVAQDETVTDIQLAAGLNLHTLAAANPTADLAHLTAGQVLHVPKENIPCPTAHTHLLHDGDTLESAALRLNVSVGALLRANPCLAPGDFVPGVCILVPDV